ncbi:MAG: glycosyltransferase family 2 protein [Polynucleobacter sp.]|uniref:glycosyltransferase family 2 protein n=1 Tax=Polynucleobacter sp. TaxID=2029855 RepID=UPI00216CF32C|nr:glycosyltransferase family 2 protein [Polynucleobacter sp.]MBU3670868.1 glycosyltransferase family 2 protein [Polynucleobacter sp.]
MTRHSVILTCFNGSEFIAEAICSVLDQLGQNDELIVVDDGSNDDSLSRVQLIADERIRIHCRAQNSGIAAARNDALRLVRGDFVSFIDHDDRWGDARIKDFEAIVAKNNDTDVVHGVVAHFFDDPALDQQYKLPDMQNAVLSGSVTISKGLIQKIGFFDETLTCGDFVDFMARAKIMSDRWIASDQIYLHRRIHGKNYTLTHAKDSSGYLSVVRAHLLRKGARSHE